MSSRQDPHYHSDQDHYYEGGSGTPVARHSPSSVLSWAPGAMTINQNDYSESHQSLDQVEPLLETLDAEARSCHNTEDSAIYPPVNLYDHLHSSYSSQGTSVQNPDVGTNATYTNDPRFDLATLPFYSCADPNDGHYELQSSYPHYRSISNIQEQPFMDSAYTMNDLIHSFGVSHVLEGIHNMHQASQSLPPPAHPTSAQLLSHCNDGHVHAADSMPMPVRPSPESFALDDTGSMEHSNADTEHSHLPPVATSSNRILTADPSRHIPSSPERKRMLPLSHDDTARRVVPRSDVAESVRSASSDLHSRTDVLVPGRGPSIPQDRYTTSGVASYKTSDQHPAIITFDLENPNEVGIPIIDILNKTGGFNRMRDRTQAFNHMGKKTFTLRMQWPGYKPWSKTIAALDWTKARAPIAREKLAEAVAAAVKGMLQLKRDEKCSEEHGQWNIGPNGIQLDQLCLVALHHVSKGSWQPDLCLLQPRQQ